MRGFSFNGKHIYKDFEYGFFMHSKSIQPPSKKKVKDSVPFMNGSYDFSTVSTNGEIVYEERNISIEIGLPGWSKEKLYVLYSRALQWLVDVGQSRLIFDDIPDYYFMAEVENASSFEQVMEFGKLRVEFIAEPFKQGVDLAGDNEWDTFNFEEDWLQDLAYNVVTTRSITLWNPGRRITPVINCTAPMSVVIGGVTHNLVVGDNKKYSLKLQNGENIMVVNGTGTIKFLFRKEVL